MSTPENSQTPGNEQTRSISRKAKQQADTSFENTTPVTPHEAASDLLVGPYVLKKEIGSGGQGSVWLADQLEPIQREVAVKIIRRNLLDEDGLQRFEAERQALALMSHPNIATVFDAGTTPLQGTYLVMEYCPGDPLIKYCNIKKLEMADRLKIFSKVCKAIQHAHQKGIIHRDLKPSNILVSNQDEIGEPKVIDFGLAKPVDATVKLSEQELHSEVGAVRGTFNYMSPEQAAGKIDVIDTRTDIFALGVLLYELICGETPVPIHSLTGQPIHEVIPLIIEQTPEKPSRRFASYPKEKKQRFALERQMHARSLEAFLAKELDWIALKAIHPEPEHRYSTVAELDADVWRFLNQDPILARPPSFYYHAKKWINKNRVLFVSASAVLFVLILGIIGTLWGWSNAQTARVLAENQRIRAEDREALAVAAVQRFANVVANNPELKNNPGLESLRATLLKEPISFYEQFKEQLQNEETATPIVIGKLADAAFEHGVLSEEIGDKAEALRAFREATWFLDVLVSNAPNDPDYLSSLATSKESMAILLASLSEVDEALENHLESLSIRRELVQSHPEVVDHQIDLAHSYNNLSIFYGDISNSDEEDRYLKLAIELRRKLVSANPTGVKNKAEFATALINQGIVAAASGDFSIALDSYKEGISTLEGLANSTHNTTDIQSKLGSGYMNFGTLLDELGRGEKALEFYQKARIILKNLREKSPSSNEHIEDLATNWFNSGNTLNELGKVSDALSAYQNAFHLRETLVKRNPDVTEYQVDFASSYRDIADLHEYRGDTKNASVAFRKALEISMDAFKKNKKVFRAKVGLADSYSALGKFLADQGEFDESKQMFDEAIAIHEKIYQSHPEFMENVKDVTKTYMRFASFYRTLGEFETAESLYKKSLDVAETHAKANPQSAESQTNWSGALSNMAIACRDSAKPDAALKYQRRASNVLRNYIETHGSSPQVQEKLAINLSNHAVFFNENNETEKAIEAAKQALEIRQQLVELVPDSIEFKAQLATSYQNLAMFQFEAEIPTNDTIRNCLAALKIRETIHKRFPANRLHCQALTVSLANYSVVLHRRNRTKQAIAVNQRAIKLQKTLVEDFPEVIEYAQSLSNRLINLSAYMEDDDQLELAIQLFEEAKAIQNDLCKRFPKNPVLVLELSVLHNKFGDLLSRLDRSEDAISKYKQALGIQRTLVEETSQSSDFLEELADTLYDLGYEYAELNRFQTALKFYGEAKQIWVSLEDVEEIQSMEDDIQSLAERNEKFPTFKQQLSELKAVQDLKDYKNCLELADYSYRTKLFRLSMNLYEQAFNLNPEAQNDREEEYAFHAACSAVAASFDKRAERLQSETDNKILRAKALKWLKSELSIWEELGKSKNSADRQAALDALRYWRLDSDLAQVKSSPNLEMLDNDERKIFERFWKKVDDTIGNIRGY